VYNLVEVYIVIQCVMIKEIFDRDFESNNSKSSEERQTFDVSENEINQQQLNKKRQEAKEQQEQELNNKMNELERLEVQEFIRKNCVEPIEWVDKVIWFNEFAQLLIKSAEEENLPEVKKSIQEWDAKDERIYKLPAYNHLIEKWFILPSDVRTYYDSANKEPVHHLWIDYNVKWGTEVKSLYDWEVVWSWYTWEPWKSSLWHKVIIRHKMPDWTEFYSLYGHLWKSGLISQWTLVKKWDTIWKVWEALTDENWNWNSHLHFQIMENENSPEWYSRIEWEWNYDVLKSFGKEQI